MEASSIGYLVKQARKSKKDILIVSINDDTMKLDTSEKIEIVDNKTILYGDRIMINTSFILKVKILY